MTDPKNADKQLIDMVLLALNHGISSISSGEPLIPFVLCQGNSEKMLHRFVPKDFSKMEETLHIMENEIKKLTPIPNFIAMTFEGIVTIEDEKTDAIMVKAFDTTKDEGFIFAQRYKPKAFLRKLKPIGSPVYLGNEPNPIKK